jgi:hypothetical protein
MSKIYLVQGDSGPQMKATLTRDDTGSVIDITGATVTLKVRPVGSETVSFTTNSITSASSDLQNGIAIFAFSSSNLSVSAGNYEGEIEVTFASGDIETVYETIQIVVREDF